MIVLPAVLWVWGCYLRVGIYKVRLLDLLLVQYSFNTHMISFARVMYFHVLCPRDASWEAIWALEF